MDKRDQTLTLAAEKAIRFYVIKLWHQGSSLVSCMARGDVSGQPGFWHARVHVIPRYKGDMPNPRGGVRGVIPFKASYRDAGPRSRAADKC